MFLSFWTGNHLATQFYLVRGLNEARSFPLTPEPKIREPTRSTIPPVLDDPPRPYCSNCKGGLITTVNGGSFSRQFTLDFTKFSKAFFLQSHHQAPSSRSNGFRFFNQKRKHQPAFYDAEGNHPIPKSKHSVGG